MIVEPFAAWNKEDIKQTVVNEKDAREFQKLYQSDPPPVEDQPLVDSPLSPESPGAAVITPEGITVTGTNEEQAYVLEALDKLRSTPSGRELLDNIANQPVHTVDIVVANSGGGPNAGSVQADAVFTPVGTYDGIPGSGVSTTVTIDPEFFTGEQAINVDGSHGSPFIFQPDEIVFHELAHALDNANGGIDVRQEDGTFYAEFDAIDATNQYRQDRADVIGGTAFERQGHNGTILEVQEPLL